MCDAGEEEIVATFWGGTKAEKVSCSNPKAKNVSHLQMD